MKLRYYGIVVKRRMLGKVKGMLSKISVKALFLFWL